MGPQRAPGAGPNLGTLTTESGRQQIRRLEGASTPLIDWIKSQLPGYVAGRTRTVGIAIPRIPVGPPGVAVPGTGTSLPSILTGPATSPPPSVPPQIDRRDITPDTEVVQIMWSKGADGTWTLTYPGVGTWPALSDRGAATLAKELGIQGPEASANGATGLQTQPGGTDMDLGTLAADLLKQAGTAYIQKEFGTGAGMQYGVISPSFLPDIDLGVPGPGILTPSAPACGGASPVYKKVCGEYKWVTPKRRRRKRLATQGDLKDLAALKGILGNGKAFEVWIATHS